MKLDLHEVEFSDLTLKNILINVTFAELVMRRPLLRKLPLNEGEVSHLS